MPRYTEVGVWLPTTGTTVAERGSVGHSGDVGGGRYGGTVSRRAADTEGVNATWRIFHACQGVLTASAWTVLSGTTTRRGSPAGHLPEQRPATVRLFAAGLWEAQRTTNDVKYRGEASC